MMDARATGPVTIETPLGEGAAALRSMAGDEALSELFAYEVEFVSDRADVGASDMLGRSVTVHLQAGPAEDQLRHWNGRVTAFEHVDQGDDGLSRYRLTVRPWLWYLTLRGDCRIFQNLSVPDILRKVFEAAAVGDCEFELGATYEAREYVVQYRETDFDFVSRLMQSEGIYYGFRHTADKHTLVIADGPHAHEPTVGYKQVPFAPPDAQRDAEIECVRRWKASAEVESGQYAHADYDFKRPRAHLYAIAKAPSDDGVSGLEVYDYPGGFLTHGEGDAYARVRLEQARGEGRTWTGESNARGLTVGNLFSLIDHPREDQNQRYLVVSARYKLVAHDVRSHGELDENPFECDFRAIKSDIAFRPPRVTPKPRALGPQTALVVGPEGQEIWTDKYGRIKVQFFWDREGKADENSSCWIRVSQPWAGSGWGAQFIPRIGQEVVVDFLEGDPDQPIVTGSVYNGANDPPFKLPDNGTQSGVRTSSSPRGSRLNANEIRFEDARGNEDLFIQAEKTQTTLVKGNQSVTVGANRALAVAGAEAISIGLVRAVQVMGESATTIGADCVESIGGSLRTTVGGEHVEAIAGGSATTIAKSSLTQVGGVARFDLGEALRLSAAGDESWTIGGASEVRRGGTASFLHGADTKTVVGHPDREASLSMYVYGTNSSITSKELVIQSDTSIVLQCGDTKVEITPDGVKMGGKAIALNGPKVSITSPYASLAVDDNVTATGKQVTVSSSGARLALASDAKLLGAKVQLGAGSGATASGSSGKGKDRKDKPTFVRTKILRAGKPAAGVAYKLVLDGKTTLSGATTGAGLVEQKVPNTVAAAELTLLDTGEKHTFVISSIEPVDTIVGAQHRLKRLGFYHGALDGAEGPLTAHALAVFQKAKGVAQTGKLDAATQSALKAAYGS
jgi:type VI secretion system secreted protein VgrG